MFTIDQSALETTDAHPLRPQHQLAERIVETIHKSKRIIVVTGAGISVSGGIPDFRSFDGLYNLVKSRYPETFVKGKDLFDASLFKNEDTTKVFYSFMSELKQVVNKVSSSILIHIHIWKSV
jgi:NAD+-dependent protein deacetylase SIR2